MQKKVDWKEQAKEVFALLNKARTDPSWVAQELLKYKGYYKGMEYKNPALGFIFETQEGVKAVEDAIDYLKKKVYPQKPLIWNEKIQTSAQYLLTHFDETGATSAQSSDFQLQQRMKKELGSVNSIAESSSFGFENPKEIIFQLVIDDGVQSRANRKNLYSPSFSDVGIVMGPHKDYGFCCILDFHGDGKKEQKQMEKYNLKKSDWPLNAVSLQTHLESKTDGSKKKVLATYNFTLADGKTETIIKEYFEEV